MDVVNPSEFGTVTFGEPEAVELAFAGDPQRQVTAACAHGEWRPPERLAQLLPEGFFVPIDCCTGPDGLRHIIPRCSFEELIDVGAVGGLAVLHDVRGFNEEVDHSYRAMLLIHQHVRGRTYRQTRGMKEHLTRKFDYSRDLYIRRLGRPSDGERNVLPDDAGRTSEGEGHRLSVTRLTKLGRQAAQEAGYRNPASKHAIAFELFEAAKLNPLEVDVDEVPALVRTALFDIDCSNHAPSEEFIEIVTERLLEAIHRHLVDPREAFDKWFCEPSNSVVKQIAQQKRKRGGKLQRDEVRQALLHLGWRAYEYVGQCVHALMRTIKNSMPDPLNDEEKRRFEHMYESQPYYGNMPLALLAERMPFLRRAILAIWDEPQNEHHVAVLHRMLQYYAEMATKRRQADRQSKDHSLRAKDESMGKCGVIEDPSADEHERPPAEDVNDGDESSGSGREGATQVGGGSVSFIENLHPRAASVNSAFEEVAEHIRELYGIDCSQGCSRWEHRKLDDTEDFVTLSFRCLCGRESQTVRMTLKEFGDLAYEILGWKRRFEDDEVSPMGHGPDGDT